MVHLLPPDTERLMARRARVLGPAYRLFYETPLHLVRGEGVWLFDVDGRRYLDAYNNVASVGHAHPHVVAAIARQAATLDTHTRYLHDSVLEVLAAFGRECRYFNTFGGNPVSMAAGLAVLDAVEREGLMANALRVGDYLRTRLDSLGSQHRLIGDVRGAGLFIGVELVGDGGARHPSPRRLHASSTPCASAACC